MAQYFALRFRLPQCQFPQTLEGLLSFFEVSLQLGVLRTKVATFVSSLSINDRTRLIIPHGQSPRSHQRVKRHPYTEPIDR